MINTLEPNRVLIPYLKRVRPQLRSFRQGQPDSGSVGRSETSSGSVFGQRRNQQDNIKIIITSRKYSRGTERHYRLIFPNLWGQRWSQVSLIRKKDGEESCVLAWMQLFKWVLFEKWMCMIGWSLVIWGWRSLLGFCKDGDVWWINCLDLNYFVNISLVKLRKVLTLF